MLNAQRAVEPILPVSQCATFGEYLPTNQLKAYTGRSAHRFKIDRMQKRGCPYIQLNGRIYYRRRDLDEYMAAHLVHPSDTPKAA